MLSLTFSAPPGDLTRFEAQAALLEDFRPHPAEEALSQLGQAVMTEVLDLLGDTALEDFQATIAEALIGGFHSAIQRIEREADRARDSLQRLTRDFDGSEVGDVELQSVQQKAHAADVAIMAVELMRDAAASTYTTATGEVWAPWRGSTRGSRVTAAQVDAREALRAAKARRQSVADPGAALVAFRASPKADTALDAGRVFDALNWALQQWPDMALATTGAPGAERLAIRWARQKRVKLVLARVDFDRHQKAAPFRANDTLLELEPVCCLTLAQSLDVARKAGDRPFGPALNLAEKAAAKGVRHLAIRRRDG